MRWQLSFLACVSVIAAIPPALAHHSFAMFDQANPVVLEGVVQEFKFINPHSYILVVVKQAGGATQLWTLEGTSPSSLVRNGWSSKSLKSGDEIRVKMWPLRSGAPGGGWTAEEISFRDGKPIAEPAKEY